MKTMTMIHAIHMIHILQIKLGKRFFEKGDEGMKVSVAIVWRIPRLT